MAAPLILVEAQPRNAATGAPVTTRLAGGGGALPYYYVGQHWRAGLAGLPTIVTSIDFDGTDLGIGSVPQAMTLRWAPASSAALAELAALHWADAAITVRVGPEGAYPPVLTAGKVLSVSARDGALSIALADPAADLKKPILVDRFAGTGGVEGPAELEDRIKPRAWGRVFNVEGFVLDAANNIYCFGDPARMWDSFVSVRDKGATAAALNVLAWQGSVAATFAALQAAAAPQGGGVACPSIACVKWWTQPSGALCADIKGENAGGYVETAAEIAQRIAASVSTVAFAAGTVAAAATARPAPVGWYQVDESGTAAAALDRILSDVSLLWVLNDDQIFIRKWEWGASVALARSVEVSRRSTFKPVIRRRLGYRRNQHVMTRDAIAGIVLATDVVLDDGTTAQDLQSITLAAMELASGKVKTFFEPAPPLASESKPGDLWFDTDDGNFMYRRLPGDTGRISFGGAVITFGGGSILYRPWAPAPDQRIAQALAQAASAISAAQDAQATADEAIDSLAALVDDGLLTGVEKKQLVIDDSRLQGAWSILDAQAALFGITTERTAAAAARTNWLALRNGLVPAWNDVSADTAVVRATFLATLGAYDDALTTLQKAISAKAATTADWTGVTGAGKDQLLADAATAKANAASALLSIGVIQSDGYLSASEKPDIIRQRIAIEAEYGGLVARAAAQGVSSTTYQGAYTALIAYLDALSPAWNNTGLDTAVVPATFNGKFTDYYFARTGLFNSTADLTAANQVAVTVAQSLEIPADYTGALAAGTLPKYIVPVVKRGGVDVTTNASITYALSNWTGGCTNTNTTVDNGAGSATKGRVAIGGDWNADGSVDLSISSNGLLVQTCPLTIKKRLASAPSGGGSGSSGFVKTGDFDIAGQSIGNTTLNEVARIPNMVKATGETIKAYFNATYTCSASANASRNMIAKWQYSVAGANSWTDLAAAVNGSNAQFLLGSGTSSTGSIPCNQTAAPANGNYDLRLVAAINNNASLATLLVESGYGFVKIEP